MNRLFAFLASASEKRPWLVVAAVLAVTLFMGAGTAGLTTELSQEAMMPKGYKSLEALDEIEDRFGGTSAENVLVVADDVTSYKIADVLLALTPADLEKEGIQEGSVTKVDTYLDGLRMMLEQEGRQVPAGFLLGPVVDWFASTPYFRNQVVGKSVSEDMKATLVKLQLDPDLSENRLVELAGELETELEVRFKSVGAKAYLAGDASMQRDMQEFMGRETRVLMFAALLFIMLILYLTFRRVSDIFLPLLIIVVAIQWILGFMGWVGIAYTTMSVAIMPLMLGINIAYVIHILSRYYEERESGANVFASATDSVKTVGVAVFLTAATTVIGFGSFVITDIPPMRDFGIICMLGIVFSFALSLTLLPAILVLRDRRKKTEKLEVHLEKMRRRRRGARYGVLVDRALVGASTSAYHHHRIVLGCLAVLIGVSVFSGFNLRTGADIRKMFPQDMPSMKANGLITKYFGAQSFDMLLVKGDIFEPGSIRALLAAEDGIASDRRNSEVRTGKLHREAIRSIADILLKANGGTIPASAAEIKAVVERMGGEMDLSGLVSKDGESALVMVGSGFSDTEQESRVKADIMRDSSDRAESGTGLEITATGLSVLISDLMGRMLPTQMRTSGLALLLCLLVLVVVFRSFFYGLATIVVVVVGIAAELIMLYALGWPLDFMTVTISALVIGAGVDFGIHVTHRFREQLHERDMTLEEAIRTTVLNVGRALVAAAFTTSGVFAILGISTMVPLRRFGWTIAVGLLAALVGAVVVLPSLLAAVSRRKHEVAAGDGGAVDVPERA